jgi:hypothetical protein
MNHQRRHGKLLGQAIPHGPSRHVGFDPALVFDDFAVGGCRGVEKRGGGEQHREGKSLAIAQQLRPI